MNAEGRFVAFSMFLAAVVLFLIGACTDEGTWQYHKDGSYGPARWHSKFIRDPLHWDSGVLDYQHVSDSAPESLKPFYDPELTRALNQ